MFHWKRAYLAAFLVIVPCTSDAVQDTPPQPKHVLILYSQRHVLPINLQWDLGIRKGLEANLGEPVAIDVEYLDFERLRKREHRDNWVELLRLKYADRPPDVVIPVNDSAAACIAELYPDLFPDASVVFCSVSQQRLSRLPITSRMTGVVYRLDFQGTLDIVRSLFPATRVVVVVAGTAEADQGNLMAAKNVFADNKQFEFVYWSGLPVADLCARASELEPGTAILYLSQIRDREGRLSITSVDVAQRLSESAQVPLFGLYDTLMGAGIVGGNLGPVELQGQRAGELAARVIRGESPSDIPILGTEMNCPMFDWRQLRRWGIDERELPAGSIVMFREPTLWEEYGSYVAAGFTAIGLQAVLIMVLLMNRRKRRRAERTLADQLQFETMLSDVSSRFVGISSGDISAEIEKALACIVGQLGLDRGALFLLSEDGQALRANFTFVRTGETQPPPVIALDSIPWMWSQLTQGDIFRVSSMSDLPVEAFHERELADHLGVKSVAAVALWDNDKVIGMLTFGVRTHEQAWDERILLRMRLISEVIGSAMGHIRANEALVASRNEKRQLAGRILSAQEDERARIARELHDDISQRLATGAIRAGKVEQELTAPSATRTTLTDLKEHLITLSDDVHRLSRQLHPSILDDLGLSDALRTECDRVAEHGHLTVDFRCGRLPACVPKDLALCMYRVAQEALQNAAKHAQAKRVDLTLNADMEFLDLEIRDDGRGFDASAPRFGLGLASMEERIRLVGGEILFSSHPGQGTTIQARVPLPEEQ